MSKRIVCLFLALLLLAVPFTAQAAYEGKITSDHVLLMDYDSGAILYEKDAYSKAYPASTTKIMTCILVLENCENIREKVLIGDIVKEYGPGNSLMGLIAGDEVRVKELLYGLMLPSGNDAAAVLAQKFGGSIEGFADMMNAKAQELGMSDTHYVTPHGLHNEDHYTTAADMAKLVRYVMQNGDFMAIVGTPSYTCPATKKSEERTLYNSNRFISPRSKNKSYNWDAVTGMKTGYTNPAGGCLVTTAEQDGKTLLCILLGDRSDGQEARWSESRALLEYGFENLTSLSLSELSLTAPELQVSDASVRDAEGGRLQVVFDTSGQKVSGLKEVLDGALEHPEEVKITLDCEDVIAPVEAGQKLGTATLSYNGSELGTVDVSASRSVESTASDPVVVPEDDSQENNGPSLLSGEAIPTEKKGMSTYAIIVLVLLVLILLLALARLRVILRRRRRQRRRRQMLEDARQQESGNRY